MIEKVSVTSVEGDYPFKVFRGVIHVGKFEARFEGVVYQSVGGPNVRSTIIPEDAENLRRNGFSEKEIEGLELELQQKILNGELSLERDG